MRNRKGFTLVELLAIIVIIAIITLITVPIVKNMIKASRKKAFEASLQSLISSAKTYYSSNAGDEFNTTVFTIKDHKIKPGDLETKGKLPWRGKIEIKGVNGEDTTIPDGDIWLQAVDDTQTFCGYKNHKDELKITEDLSKCDKLDLEDIDDPDLSDPELNIVTDENVTGNSIGVYARCTHESGIKEVMFKRGNGQWYTSNRYSGNQYFYKFTNLEHNKWYEFTVKCIANNGQSVEDKTNSMLAIAEQPDYYTSDSWVRQREIIVSYPKPGVSGVEYTYQYKIGEDDTFKTIGTRTCSGQECKDESSSTNKYKIETYTGETCASDKVCYKFTFYDEVFNGKPLITNVKVNDEDTTNECPIKRIDRTAPTWNKIINPSGGEWVNKEVGKIIVTLKATDNSGSGIKHYKYSYSSNPSGDSTSSADSNSKWIIYTNSNTDEFETTPYTAERNQYSYFQVCDNVGNCSETNKTMIRIDKTAPSFTINCPKCGYWINTSKVEVYLSASGETPNTSGYAGHKWRFGGKNAQFTQLITGASRDYYYEDRESENSDNNQTRYFVYCDKAGNCSGEKMVKIMIDRTPPSNPTIALKKWEGKNLPTSPSSSGVGGNYTSGSWVGNKINVLAYATSTDNLTSAGDISYRGDISGKYGKTIFRRYNNFTKQQRATIRFRACDPAENCSGWSAEKEINIDRTAPKIKVKGDNKSACTFTATVTMGDSLSGLDTNSLKFKGKDKWKFFKDGGYTVVAADNINGREAQFTHTWNTNQDWKTQYYAADRAGNEAYSKELHVKNDTSDCKTDSTEDENDPSEQSSGSYDESCGTPKLTSYIYVKGGGNGCSSTVPYNFPENPTNGAFSGSSSVGSSGQAFIAVKKNSYAEGYLIRCANSSTHNEMDKADSEHDADWNKLYKGYQQGNFTKTTEPNTVCGASGTWYYLKLPVQSGQTCRVRLINCGKLYYDHLYMFST